MKTIKVKTILIVSLISLPFWWGINVMEKNLKDFFFWQYSYSQPVLSAQLLPLPISAKDRLAELSAEEIAAKSVLSVRVDKEGGEQVLFDKNPVQVLPIASLTKLMTAWVVFEYPEYYDFSQIIRISNEAIAQEGNFGLQVGQAVSANDLLYSMLIESNNDAAFALAEAMIPDSAASPRQKVEAFVGLMNLKAEKELGLKNTHFVNPTGLEGSLSTNYSTAEDLVKLAKDIIFRHPGIFEISNRKTALIFGDYLAINRNEILSESTMGGKTGWTPSAGGCILLVLKDGGGYVINVVLGTDSSESRFTEMRKLIE